MNCTTCAETSKQACRVLSFRAATKLANTFRRETGHEAYPTPKARRRSSTVHAPTGAGAGTAGRTQIWCRVSTALVGTSSTDQYSPCPRMAQLCTALSVAAPVNRLSMPTAAVVRASGRKALCPGNPWLLRRSSVTMPAARLVVPVARASRMLGAEVLKWITREWEEVLAKKRTCKRSRTTNHPSLQEQWTLQKCDSRTGERAVAEDFPARFRHWKRCCG